MVLAHTIGLGLCLSLIVLALVCTIGLGLYLSLCLCAMAVVLLLPVYWCGWRWSVRLSWGWVDSRVGGGQVSVVCST